MTNDPPTQGGWQRIPEPVLGGETLGTCFEAQVMEWEGKLRLYFSWRPPSAICLRNYVSFRSRSRTTRRMGVPSNPKTERIWFSI